MKNVFVLILFSTIFTFINFAQADYGDAPDDTLWGIVPAHFNSLDINTGPKHLQGHLSTYWIGESSTNSTTLEPDAMLIDEDQDDGRPFIFVWLIGQPAPAQATIPISTSASHDPNQPIYINMALDVDQDMDYNTDVWISDNWVVQNYALLVPADTTIYYDTKIFNFGNDPWLFPLWGRITLTSVPVSPLLHWDGSGPVGGWLLGETEDWFFLGGRNPGEYGGNSGSSHGKNGGGNNNKRKKRTPPKAQLEKFAVMKYPKIVYLKCEQTKCFQVTVENRGGLPISDLHFGFNYTHGNPVPGGITLAPGSPDPANTVLYPNPPDREMTFTFCVTGWPCTTPEEDRYAKYKVKLTCDPEGIYSFQEFDLILRDGEFPSYNDENMVMHTNLAAGTKDSFDFDPWIGKVNQALNQNLFAWTGRYPMNGPRWIQSDPVMTPLYIPSWMTASSSMEGPDSMKLNLSGTPTMFDNGIDSAIFLVDVTDPILDPTIEPWIYKVPIYIEFDNSAPQIQNTFLDTLNINTNLNESITQTIKVIDSDVVNGYDDFLFVDFYLWNIAEDSLVTPQPFPSFEDSTNGMATFSWTPTVNDHGNYKLITVAWDYYGAIDTQVSFLNINSLIGVNELENRLSWLNVFPNPFNNQINVEFELLSRENVKIELLDIFGREIYSKELGSMKKGIQQHSIKLDGQAKGLYFMNLHLDGKIISVKLVNEN